MRPYAVRPGNTDFYTACERWFLGPSEQVLESEKLYKVGGDRVEPAVRSIESIIHQIQCPTPSFSMGINVCEHYHSQFACYFPQDGFGDSAYNSDDLDEWWILKARGTRHYRLMDCRFGFLDKGCCTHMDWKLLCKDQATCKANEPDDVRQRCRKWICHLCKVLNAACCGSCGASTCNGCTIVQMCDGCDSDYCDRCGNQECEVCEPYRRTSHQGEVTEYKQVQCPACRHEIHSLDVKADEDEAGGEEEA